MVATTLTTERPLRWTLSVGDLVLRISGSSRDGQIVRLKSAKCTIGSGPHCTLRLRAHGVIAPALPDPPRSAQATVVRCWSADTRLNHQSFTDAALSCGDRLSIGPIELEVLGVGATSPAQEPPIKQDAAQPAAHQQRQQLTAQLAEVESQQNALTEERRQWQVEQEDTLHGIDQQRQQLTAQLAEVESQQNALTEERRQWQAEQERVALRGIDQQRQQLTAQSAEVESQQNALTEERRQWQVEQEDTLRSIDQQRQQLTAQSAEVESQQNALTEERRQWQAEQEDTLRSSTNGANN